ncbi:MAG: hypothetical protein R8G33_00300 [Gammaproteobacteria bacterium]|nr:hypothetical protein [Gammaproteobacteria bacterium]
MKLILIILLLFSSTISAEDTAQESPAVIKDKTYLCSTEESSGYDYKNGRWIRERFTPDATYLVKLKGTKWSVYEYDTEYEHETCAPMLDKILACNTNGDFIMNIDTMKFSVTNTAPYVHSSRKNRDSVVLILGSCVAMK